MHRYDTNHNGTLDVREFRALVEEIERAQKENPNIAPGDMIAQLFYKYDTDRSNDLDQSELFRALNDLGLHATSAQVLPSTSPAGLAC